MTGKAIEPSEILVGGSRKVHEESIRGNPWIRFFARFFDYSLFLLLLWGVCSWTHTFSLLKEYDYFIPLEFMLWIPLEALLLSTWGSTPGKFFLKVHLSSLKQEKKLSYQGALKRSFHVWFRALGMWIPFINVICLLMAYQKLKVFRTTSWDRDNYTKVTYLPIPRWRIIFAIVVAIGGFLFYYQRKSF